MAAHFLFNFLFSDPFHVATFLLLGLMYAFLVRQNLGTHKESRALEASNKEARLWLNDLVKMVEEVRRLEARRAIEYLPRVPKQFVLPSLLHAAHIVILAHKPPNLERKDIANAICQQLSTEIDLTMRVFESLPTYDPWQRDKDFQELLYRAHRSSTVYLRKYDTDYFEKLHKSILDGTSTFAENDLLRDCVLVISETRIHIEAACEYLYRDMEVASPTCCCYDSEDGIDEIDQEPVEHSDGEEGSGERRGVKRRRT